MADARGYNNLWNVNGGVAIGDTLPIEQSETDFYGLLTPNALRNDPGLFGVETYVHE